MPYVRLQKISVWNVPQNTCHDDSGECMHAQVSILKIPMLSLSRTRFSIVYVAGSLIYLARLRQHL